MKLATAFLVTAIATLTPFMNAKSETGDVEKGEQLLQTNCSRCHAIGKTGTSTHPQAPPFRDVVTRYPAVNLAEALAEGIITGHPDMPVFTFDPGEIDAIVAYLDSLAPPRAD